MVLRIRVLNDFDCIVFFNKLEVGEYKTMEKIIGQTGVCPIILIKKKSDLSISLKSFFELVYYIQWLSDKNKYLKTDLWRPNLTGVCRQRNNQM